MNSTRPVVSRRRSRALPWVSALGAAVLVFGIAVAQSPYGFGGRRGGEIVRGIPDDPAGFMFCRLMFEAVRSDPSGTGWEIEYPRAEQNLMLRLSQLTLTPIAKWANGQPGHTVVRATDEEIYRCPFLMMASPGTAGFTDEEVEALRSYLLKGGFLWGDDFWGNASWRHWASEIGRVLPEYEIIDIPVTHPIFSTYYNLDALPQIPALNRWRPGMSTSELGGGKRDPEHPRHLRRDR